MYPGLAGRWSPPISAHGPTPPATYAVVRLAPSTPSARWSTILEHAASRRYLAGVMPVGIAPASRTSRMGETGLMIMSVEAAWPCRGRGRSPRDILVSWTRQRSAGRRHLYQPKDQRNGRRRATPRLTAAGHADPRCSSAAVSITVAGKRGRITATGIHRQGMWWTCGVYSPGVIAHLFVAAERR